ncbi:epimerase [Hyphomicrobium methylovorum]|uniref:NAD(P)-dependent oxidoreductase n=1 Tax=Hyphomicrobium methylovorum TaxID=84 RepID=UPI0015E6745D|nr:SDR family oxidoreductase [Hyphomicrobium methylovorum]MBA2127139.1 epimerase [Hyphomicrobium methylovorum]
MSVIVVFGASRGIGLETVKTALMAGHEVRAFARSAPKIALTHPKLTKITGDALVPEEVISSLQGADAVIQSLGVSSPSDLIFGTTLFSSATRILVDAMRDATVRRLLLVTGAGAGNSRGRINPLYDNLIFPLLLQRVYNDKDIAEDLVMKSGLDWTIARPGGLTNGAATGTYKVLIEPKDWRGGFISRADVADFLVKHIDDKSSFQTAPLLIN